MQQTTFLEHAHAAQSSRRRSLVSSTLGLELPHAHHVLNGNVHNEEEKDRAPASRHDDTGDLMEGKAGNNSDIADKTEEMDTFQSGDPDVQAALDQLRHPDLFLHNPIFKMLLRVPPEEFVDRMNVIFTNMAIISGLMLGGASNCVFGNLEDPGEDTDPIRALTKDWYNATACALLVITAINTIFLTYIIHLIAAENPSTGYRFGVKAAYWTWIYFFNTYLATFLYLLVALLGMFIHSSFSFALWMTVAVVIYFILNVFYFSQMLAVLSPLMFSGWGWVFGWIRPSGTEDLLAKYSKITLKESEDNINQYINKERAAELFRETGRIQAKRASQLAASFATSPSGKQVKAFLTTVFPKGANFDTVLAVFEKEKYRIDDLSALAKKDGVIVYEMLKGDIAKVDLIAILNGLYTYTNSDSAAINA